MSERGGIDLLLKIKTAGGSFVTMGGLREKSYSFSADGIDITNHNSNQNREFLDGKGIFSASLSGSGVHDGDAQTLDYCEDQMIAQALTDFQIVDAATGGRTYEGSFKITSFERSGTYNEAQNYTISLESSGEVTVSS